MRLDTGLFIGLLTISVTFFGIVLSRRGQKEQARQQEAANTIADRAEQFDELNTLVGTLSAEIQRLHAQVQEMEQSKDAALARQAHRCQEIVDRLVDTIATLQSVVQDEVARAAAWDVVKDARAHRERHDGQPGQS